MPAGELSDGREQAAQRARSVLHALAAPAGDARAALRAAERLRVLEDMTVASALAGLAPFAALGALVASSAGAEPLLVSPGRGRGAVGRAPRPPASPRADAQPSVSTARAGGRIGRHGPAAERASEPADRATGTGMPASAAGGDSAHDPLTARFAPAPSRPRPRAWAPNAPLPPLAGAEPAEPLAGAERTRAGLPERSEGRDGTHVSAEALREAAGMPRGARTAGAHPPPGAGATARGRARNVSAPPPRATDASSAPSATDAPATSATAFGGAAGDAGWSTAGARPASVPHDPLPAETRALLERLLQAAARRSGAPTPRATQVRAASEQSPAGDASGTASAPAGRREPQDPAEPAAQPAGAPAFAALPERAGGFDLLPPLPTTVHGTREREPEPHAPAAMGPSQARAFGFRAFEDIAPLAGGGITGALDDGWDAPRTLAAIVNEALMEQARLHGVDLT